MTNALKQVPLFVVMIAIAALAMLVPAMHAWSVSDYAVGRAFLYSALLFLFLSVLLGLAMAGSAGGPAARGQLLSIIAILTLVPLVCAVPLNQAVRDTGLFNAWWEMVADMTTTGATLYTPDRLSPSLHLWRAMVGWMGGFFMLVMAIAVLAPLRLGGFEIFGAREAGAFARMGRRSGMGEAPSYAPSEDSATTAERLRHYTRVLLPAYAGMTGVLWILLMVAGDAPLIAACHAMSTLSTSGISPVGGLQGAQSGIAGEMLIFLFLIPALSRRLWPGGGELRPTERLIDDPELRLALALVLGVAALLFARHWIAAFDIQAPAEIGAVVRSVWGALFTALSFLTTSGFESTSWDDARAWSGLGTPGLVLTGLAITGGGIATTAGGVHLLRIYALVRHSQRELDKLVHPASVGGGGPTARWLRREGAYVAWVFFILFSLTLAVVILALTLTGLGFEPAIIMSIAALSNTGPLAAVAADHPLYWQELSVAAKTILAATMVLGRIETLAIIALLNPEFWRN